MTKRKDTATNYDLQFLDPMAGLCVEILGQAKKDIEFLRKHTKDDLMRARSRGGKVGERYNSICFGGNPVEYLLNSGSPARAYLSSCGIETSYIENKIEG